ncbi:MAG: DUF2139 domain-containing protein [Desulfurococcaceae archaeon]
MMEFLDKLVNHISTSYSPEWGSGGLFGLKYHRGVLYYTLSFEARAYFIYRDGVEVYGFEQLGKPPRCGGDTYNAVTAVDNEIYFGGWIHAPVEIYEFGGLRSIDFRNKYSHIHRYVIDEHRVELMWSESIHDRDKWAGEISELLYDPLRDSILVARADGHVNLGVYELDRDGKVFRKISELPALKGALYMDHACFDISDFARIRGFQCIDLDSAKVDTYMLPDKISELSIDGHGVKEYSSGYAVQLHGRYLHFVKGGLFIGNPLDPGFEKPVFVRLLDFGRLSLSPRRANATILAGGVLAPYSSYVEAAINIPGDMDRSEAKLLNTAISPSILLYISPPMVKVVGVFGSRITSIEKAGSRILVGYNTVANLGGHDILKVDIGMKGITVINEETLLYNTPPLIMRIPGYVLESNVFGGIPLTGYRDKRMILYSDSTNELEVYEYLLGPPPVLLSKERYDIDMGKNIVELNGFHGIISFKLGKMSGVQNMVIELS